VQELKGNIRVFCRIRPLLKDEKESCVNGQNDLVRVENKLEDKVKMFEFDRVFNSQINQVILNHRKEIFVSFILSKGRIFRRDQTFNCILFGWI